MASRATTLPRSGRWLVNRTAVVRGAVIGRHRIGAAPDAIDDAEWLVSGKAMPWTERKPVVDAPGLLVVPARLGLDDNPADRAEWALSFVPDHCGILYGHRLEIGAQLHAQFPFRAVGGDHRVYFLAQAIVPARQIDRLVFQRNEVRRNRSERKFRNMVAEPKSGLAVEGFAERMRDRVTAQLLDLSALAAKGFDHRFCAAQ